MSKAAIIHASLIDIKNVNSHKCVRLIVDVPAELAPQVLKAFGWPTAVNPVPVAVARLAVEPEEPVEEPAAAQEEAVPRRPFSTLLPAQQAGIACNERAFRRFLVDEKLAVQEALDDAEKAADAVRHYCGVDSRSKLAPGSQAARKWADLHRDYQTWQRYVA